MTRTRLPNRRAGVTEKVSWRPSWHGVPGVSSSTDTKILVTFGYDPRIPKEETRISEVFVASFNATQTIVAFAVDACIVLSRLLQYGDDIANIAESLQENRDEGQTSGPPASLLGAITRKGVEVQLYLRGKTK